MLFLNVIFATSRFSASLRSSKLCSADPLTLDSVYYPQNDQDMAQIKVLALQILID